MVETPAKALACEYCEFLKTACPIEHTSGGCFCMFINHISIVEFVDFELAKEARVSFLLKLQALVLELY